MTSESASGVPIVWKGHEDYTRARDSRLFNQRRRERFPIAVVEASKREHIKDAVQLAIKHNARLSIRSGGHSWACWSSRDDAIMLDLGNYRQIDYDEQTHLVKVSTSTDGRTLNKFLATKGRVFAGGHCPDVGLGGFLLQGGMGWNCKNWGWACEQVAGIDAVTADGKEVYCDEKENSELFWMARGAGPGFPAVVTRFHLKTRPLPKCMRQSAYFYPVSEYRSAFSWILSITGDYDPDTEIVLVTSYPPGSTEIRVMVLLVVFKDDEEAALKALQPAEDSHPPGTVDKFFNEPTSMEDQYEKQDSASPHDHRYCADNAYIKNDADIVSVLEPAFTALPSRETFSLWYSMAPCSRRELPDMALSMQSDHYFALYGIWKTDDQDQKCQKWVRDIMKGVEGHEDGAYLGDADFQIRKTRFWAPEQGKRLMDLRKKWDPKGKICGYLDVNDESGLDGLLNEFEAMDLSKL